MLLWLIPKKPLDKKTQFVVMLFCQPSNQTVETVENVQDRSVESSVASIGKQGKIETSVDPPLPYPPKKKHKRTVSKDVMSDKSEAGYTRDVDRILIYGFVRLMSELNDIDKDKLMDHTGEIFNAIYQFHTKISLMKNCFFVYGTLRDDATDSQWTESSDRYLGIIYGFKMYGINGFPAAKMTNDNSDYMIGRIIHFKDEKKFKEKVSWADDIEGYIEGQDNDSQFYIRKKIECFVFDELNDEKLKDMGYYDDQKIIDFSKESKMKQEAFIYYQINPEKSYQCATPNCDWRKRYIKKP
eukprot:337209_1